MKRLRDRHASLRARLLALLVALMGIAWVAIAVATYFDARHHTGRLFDAQLTEYSEVLGAVAAHEVYEIGESTTSLDHEYGQACTYQVYSRKGELLLRSHAAPPNPLALFDGFDEMKVAGVRWRTFRRVDAASDLVIIVAHRLDEREALMQDFAVRLLLPLGVGLPLIAGAIWLAVSRALHPLDRLAREVRHRDAASLGSLDAATAPTEVMPLVRALNQLFARLERAFENERRFTGDAAHELRTPLAGLRAHAEVALTTANDDRRRRSLEHVVAGVERASRLVEQMLALARLDAAQSAPDTPVDLGEIARESIVALQPEARRRGISLERVSHVPHATLLGESAMLQVLVRNLIENAVRHAPDEGTVRLTLSREAGLLRLDVEDSGPGVRPELRERIFDRHFRAPGEGGAAGLGLSIARRVVELHGGAIEAAQSAALGGLKVTATMPIHEAGRKAA